MQRKELFRGALDQDLDHEQDGYDEQQRCMQVKPARLYQ